MKRFVLLFGALLPLVVTPELGCGTTGSKRFTFEARAGGVERDGAAPYTFVNATGWTVTLTKANVTIGPLYLNVVAPLRAERLRFAWVRSAFADDDHLSGGRVVGEVLGRVTVDALSPSLVSFPVTGTMTEEQVRTADIWLWPSSEVPPERVDVDEPSLEVEGEATRGAAQVRFRGRLVIDAAWATDAKPGEVSADPITVVRQIRGIPATFFPREGGSLEVRIDVKPLFRGADFGSLSANPIDPDGRVRLVQAKTGSVTTDQVLRNAFQGLRAARGTYAVRWLDSQ